MLNPPNLIFSNDMVPNHATHIELHSFKLNSNTSVKRIELFAYVEKSKGGRKKVFESSTFQVPANKENKVINEGFSYHLDRSECYLILEIRALDNEVWQIVPIYLFTEDLLKRKKILIVDFGKNNFKLYYDIITSIQPSNCLREMPSNELRVGEDESMFEQLKVTREFMAKVTPIRRIHTDLGDFFAVKAIVRDLKIILIASLFIYFSLLFISLGGLVFFLIGYKFALRKKLVQFVKKYFEVHEISSIENKKNYHFLKNQQLMLIELSDTIRQVFYERNRVELSIFLRKVLVIVLAVAFIINCVKDIRLIAILGSTAILVNKYKEEIAAKLSDFGTLELTSYISNVYNQLTHPIKTLKRKKQIKLAKTCFTYENQRWFFPNGFLNMTLVFGIINRKTDVFRCERKL